jgi:hypothetical protein
MAMMWTTGSNLRRLAEFAAPHLQEPGKPVDDPTVEGAVAPLRA